MQNDPERPRPMFKVRPLLVALLLLAVSAGSLHAQVSTYGAVTSQAGAFPASAAGSDPNAAYGGSFTGTNIPFTNFDQPTAFEPMPTPPTPPASPVKRVLQAISWYIPNRLADLSDIPRFHVAAGDGQGVSLRFTKLLTVSWFEDDAYCIGWTKRTSPWFGEAIQERYLGFLAAQAGNLDRDPTEVGVSAHALLAGFNVAISLGEAADALAGFVGIDLSGDDHGPVLNDLRTPPPPGKVQAQRAVYGPQRPLPAGTPTSATTPLTATPPPSPSSTVAPDSSSSAAPTATSEALAEAAGTAGHPKASDPVRPGEAAASAKVNDPVRPSEAAAPVTTPDAATAARASSPQPPIAEVQMENEPARKLK